MKWKGVKDMKVSNDSQSVLAVSTGPKGFTFWKTDWVKMPASPMTDQDYESERRGNSNKNQDKQPPRKAVSRDNISEQHLPANLSESGNEKFDLMASFRKIREEHEKFSQMME